MYFKKKKGENRREKKKGKRKIRETASLLNSVFKGIKTSIGFPLNQHKIQFL